MRHVDPIIPARSTTVPRTTTRRTGWTKPAAQDYIDARMIFNAGSLYATTTRYPSTGELPAAWARIIREDARQCDDAGTNLYVVWSYVTPIAWVRADGTVVIPDVKYSQTTSRHQSATRMGLDKYDGNAWARDYVSAA